MIRSAKRWSRAWVSTAAASFVFALCGCGGGGSAPSVTSSTEEATVHGKVSIEGKPASSGKVSFDASNINRKSAPIVSADIGKDGTYTIKTMVGPNRVSVEAPQTAGQVFAEQSLDVKGGDNSFDPDFKKP